MCVCRGEWARGEGGKSMNLIYHLLKKCTYEELWLKFFSGHVLYTERKYNLKRGGSEEERGKIVFHPSPAFA